MKKLIAISLVGTALALSACASKGKTTDYSYENAAPYAHERTAGEGTATTTTRADRVFKSSQTK
ncbi:MAG: hypothetical protein HY370_02150 [Proteobacteria bacterium]|nr:hypothetical protein [Pseudomonadota bacterium]